MRRISRFALAAFMAASLAAALASPAVAKGGPPVDLSRANECDFIGAQETSLCMLPFPDDFYTVKDKSSATGRLINFKSGAMPQNSSSVPIDPEPYELNDGFSPGQAIVVRVPGLDTPEALAETNPVGLADLSEYKKKNAPVVVIDAKTKKRWPIWVELDSNASSPEDTALLIHPAVNFHQRHRYIVAMRNLRDETGEKLKAPNGFRYYRDDIETNKKPIERQRSRFQGIFKQLKKAGINKGNLYLAWNFTVSSDLNIAERMLHMRDDAFAGLGDKDLADREVRGAAPQFAISSVTEFAPCGGNGCQPGEDAEIERGIDGTFTVPCYLEPNCAPGGRFDLNGKGLPRQNGTWEANFRCIVPRAALDTPGAIADARPQIYGHGLLGSANEAVNSSAQQSLAQSHGFVICATDEIGFSSADIPNIAGNILPNLGNFPELTDRVQQGLLDELFLGRLMIHPDGFASDAAFHVDGSTLASPPVIDPAPRLYYNGNSQGGILGGALTAIAPDFTRASLGVPAMNYSVLLNRSVDFDTYSLILDPAYPNPMTQQLSLSLIQMLWDRSEPNGYAHRITDNPLPNTPAHEVLMNIAFGDHQVTTWQADVEARTIGASAHKPIVYSGRWPGVKPLWGIDRIQSYPFDDSAIVYWDSGPVRPDPANPGGVLGTDPPPLTNTPNRSGEDPHGNPRQAAAEQQMVSDFLMPNSQSRITDTCLGQPCYAGGFTGP